MKTPLYLSFLFLISLTIQASPKPIDSLKTNQTALSKRLDSLSTGLKRLTKTNDSLNNELRYYRAKDDFYVMAVDRQGSHFEWLLATVIGAAGLFSYTFFRREIDKIRIDSKKRLFKISQEHEKFTNDLKRVKADLYSSVGTIVNNTIYGRDMNEIPVSDLGHVLNHSFAALEYAYEVYMLASESRKKECLNIIQSRLSNTDLVLDVVFERLEEIKSNEKATSRILGDEKLINKIIRKVYSLHNDSINKSIAQIIYRHSNLLNTLKK